MKRKKSKGSGRSSNLKNRMDRSYKTKDSGSSGILTLPSDVKYFKGKEGRNKIVILPFQIKSKNNPLVKNGDAEIGEWDYMLDVWVHQRIGPSETDVVCLQKNYGKRCPLCELMKENKDDGNEDEYKALKPKRRVFYNILNCKNIDSGIQVFHVSHFLFEKELIEEARAISEDGDIVNFSDPEEGWAIKFRGSPASLSGNEFNKYKSFDFVKLDEEIDEELLEDVISFDEFMVVLTYKEMQDIIHGFDDEEEENDKTEKKVEKEKKSKNKKSKKNECPYGHEFGKDADDFKDCDDCDVWENCSGE